MRSVTGAVLAAMGRLAFVLMLVTALSARAQATEEELDRAAAAALNALYASSPGVRALRATAKAVLVFPDVRTSSFVQGAQAGDGVLFIAGSVAGHYSVGSAAARLEAGAQSYSYALFFMSDAALQDLDDPLELDMLDPDVVFVDIGAATPLPAVTNEPY